MVRSIVPALIAMVLAHVGPGCLLCDGGEVESYVYDSIYAGTVVAPDDLGVAGRPLDDCGFSGIEECMQDNAGGCGALHFGLEALSEAGFPCLVVYLDLNRVEPGTEILLPSAAVEVDAEYWPDPPTILPLELVSGSVRLEVSADRFDARFDLVLSLPDDRVLEIRGGRYAWLDGHWKTYCVD